MRTVNPQRAARNAFARATLARAEADELRNLPVNDAARRIEAQRAEQEQTAGSGQRSKRASLTHSAAVHTVAIRAATGQRAACNAAQSHSPHSRSSICC